MPLDDYDGRTFVAFTDISGFREMMRDRSRAVKALDSFYQAGYDILGLQTGQPTRVEGLFVSDCGVLFVRSRDQSPEVQLDRLLSVITSLNRLLLRSDVMLCTSVAYGQFSYHRRLEFSGIEKNPVYGNAYVAAFLDNDGGRPRIQPGQCRVMCKGLPGNLARSGRDPRLGRPKGGHRYFYWMVSVPAEIPQVQRQYSNASLLKYKAILEVLRPAAHEKPRNESLVDYFPDEKGSKKRLGDS